MRLLIVVAAVLVGSCGVGADPQTQAADSFANQYEIVAESGGSASEKCQRANLAAEGYLQAQNREQYEKWKARAGADCAIAGLEPFQNN